MNKLLTPTILIIVLFFVTYVAFTVYQPKVLRELQEVRGHKTSVLSENLINLPNPQDSQQISLDKTNNTSITTYQTNKTPNEIITFYKNIFIENGWKLKKSWEENNFNTIEYKKDNFLISIGATTQTTTNNTIVTIKTLKLED